MAIDWDKNIQPNELKAVWWSFKRDLFDKFNKKLELQVDKRCCRGPILNWMRKKLCCPNFHRRWAFRWSWGRCCPCEGLGSAPALRVFLGLWSSWLHTPRGRSVRARSSLMYGDKWPRTSGTFDPFCSWPAALSTSPTSWHRVYLSSIYMYEIIQRVSKQNYPLIQSNPIQSEYYFIHLWQNNATRKLC